MIFCFNLSKVKDLASNNEKEIQGLYFIYEIFFLYSKQEIFRCCRNELLVMSYNTFYTV